eukprot:COSAG01_NODE_160_length_23692_cov_9.703599_13_plen_92_part_00
MIVQLTSKASIRPVPPHFSSQGHLLPFALHTQPLLVAVQLDTRHSASGRASAFASAVASCVGSPQRQWLPASTPAALRLWACPAVSVLYFS